VTWSDGLEPEEKEIPDDILVIMVEAVQAGNHMGNLQLLLCILQQRDECMFTAIS
jgi:hypothetical protein